MRSNYIYGYGFTVDTLKPEDAVRFLSTHSETLKTMNPDYDKSVLDIILAGIVNHTDIEDMDESVVPFFEKFKGLYTDPDFDELMKCITELVGLVIAKESGISVNTYFAMEDCAGEDCIMLTSRLPWEFHGKEQVISITECKELFENYIHELNLDTVPDYLEIEYFG